MYSVIWTFVLFNFINFDQILIISFRNYFTLKKVYLGKTFHVLGSRSNTCSEHLQKLCLIEIIVHSKYASLCNNHCPTKGWKIKTTKSWKTINTHPFTKVDSGTKMYLGFLKQKSKTSTWLTDSDVLHKLVY